MTIVLDYTFEDYAAARRADLQQHRLREVIMWSILWLLLGGFIVFIGLYGPGEPNVYALAFALVISMVSAPVLNHFSLWRSWKQMESAGGGVETEFTERGVSIATAGARAEVEWHVFTHYRESPRVFLLYQGRNHYNYFPKRAFQGEREVEQFRGMLERHIGRVTYSAAANRGFPVVEKTPHSPPS